VHGHAVEATPGDDLGGEARRDRQPRVDAGLAGFQSSLELVHDVSLSPLCRTLIGRARKRNGLPRKGWIRQASRRWRRDDGDHGKRPNMKLARRTFLHLATGAAALPSFARLAHAQAYPTRPVHMLVGLAAGGARMLAEWLSEQFGQQFVVENR